MAITNYSPRELTLSVSQKKGNKYVYAKQGDALSRKLTITLVDDSTALTFGSGERAAIRVQKPDGTSRVEEATIGNDGVISVELSDQILAVSGLILADIVIYSGTTIILSSEVFTIEAEAAPIGRDAASESDVNFFNSLVEEGLDVIDEFSTKIAQLDNIVAQAGDASQNTEIVDARVDNDGNVHTTVGANIRATQEALEDKVDKVEGKGLSTNDYTTAEKNKLGEIETGANKTTVDSSLSSSSENPVQNKKVKEAIDNIAQVPSSGSTGQVLTKTANGYEWKNSQHQDISGKEDASNRVTALSSASTDGQYPSAKCVYNAIKNRIDYEVVTGILPLSALDNFTDTNKIYHFYCSDSSIAEEASLIFIDSGEAIESGGRTLHPECAQIIFTESGRMLKRLSDDEGIWGAVSSITPTKVSELTNDSGFLTQHQDVSGKENTSNKKSEIAIESQTGDANVNYPTVGAVRNYVNSQNELQDFFYSKTFLTVDILAQLGVALSFNNTNKKLSLLNPSGQPLGDSVTITPGLEGASVDVVKEGDVNYIVLFDADGIEVSRAELPVGSGGGAASSTLRVVFIGSNTLNVADNQPSIVRYSFSSLIDGVETGNGTAVYSVNGSVKATSEIQQGNVSFNCADYLKEGQNTVTVKVTDSYGSSRTLRWTVNLITLSISSSFDASIAYKDTNLIFKYTVMGEGDKTVHFIVDGTEVSTASAPIPNRQYSETIDALSHGDHIIEIYADVLVNESLIRSNVLRYAVICLESENSNKVIACDFNTTQAKQGDLLTFKYIVYDPENLNSAVTLKVNNNVVQSVTVDRTLQTWNIKNYPEGNTVFTIQSGSTAKSFTVVVEAYEPPVSMTDTGLVLDLSSVGRSNSEESPDEWSYEDISAEMTGFNFNSNGWISDENGDTALRINSNAQAVIDFYPFETDCRDNGKVIELEFAIRSALADNVPLISCLGATGVGFEVYPNKFIFSSAQTSVIAPFKDEEKIRIALVIQDKSQNRLVSTYLNGVCCGSVQYALTDDFSQPIPVPITLGAGSSVCGIDFYNIRIYENDLNMYEILNNYIASRTKPEEIEELFQKNNIFDSYGHMIYDNVLARIPCMTYIGELPTFKGDKKTVNMIYENMQDTARSFTANGVELDVQGTSSATLPKKNFKFKIKNGCTMTATGETLSKYQLTADSIPEKNYCMKANYMDSSNCHNTEMARIIPMLMPQLPQQEVDSRIRSTILGFPCVIWHKATEDSEREFIGIYDFNHDKSDTDTFGCGGQWPNAQIIEFRNNTSSACLFLSTNRDADDFEFRYPDEGTDYTDFDEFLAWGVSHNLAEWTGDNLDEPYTASDGTTYDTDTQEYRIAKFRDEAPEHIDVEAMYSYWLNCDVFCMADSLVKNFFSGTSDTETDVKRPYPYDMDTVFGLNNEGVISFSPFVEMHDKVGGSFVYNGERSRFWNNIEIAYKSEIKKLYQSWRSRTVNKLSYDWLINSFYNNTISKLSAALYNLDGNYKYLSPLVEDNDASHLFCWQGDRFEYLKWWWSNRVKYKDGQYEAGDYMANYIQMRLYTPASDEELAIEADFDFDLKSYLPGYLRVKFGSKLRGGRQPNPNTITHIEAPDDVFNDTECIIYGYGITDIGDLAPKYVGTVDISMGTSLTNLKIGDTTEGYVNENLKVLSLGNNALLKTLNIANCPNLTDSIDASGCTDIESIEARGSSITGITLPVGGNLKRLNLPATVSNLTVINHSGINEMIIEGCENITTLRLENFPLDIKNILSRSTSLYRVRLLNVYIVDSSFELLERISTTCIGLDENNNNLPSAVITGRYHISGTIRMSDKVKYEDEFNGLTVTADTIIDDVLYDVDGNVVIDKNNNVIVMPDDTAFTVSYTADELDTWIDDVDEAIRQIEDESGENNE